MATLIQAVAWLGLMNMDVGTGLQNLVTAAYAKQDWVAIGRLCNSGLALLGGLNGVRKFFISSAGDVLGKDYRTSSIAIPDSRDR